MGAAGFDDEKGHKHEHSDDDRNENRGDEERARFRGVDDPVHDKHQADE